MSAVEGPLRHLRRKVQAVNFWNPPSVFLDGFQSLVTESAIEITKIWSVLLNDLLHFPIKVSGAFSSLFHNKSLTQFCDFVVDARGDLAILALQLSQLQEFA
jgi:hypothetical protein